MVYTVVVGPLSLAGCLPAEVPFILKVVRDITYVLLFVHRLIIHYSMIGKYHMSVS